MPLGAATTPAHHFVLPSTQGSALARNYEQSALAGQPWTRGPRCFGYRRDGKTVIPEEAAIIREVVTGVLGGDSLHKWILELQRRGVETTLGNEWSTTALRELLLNPKLAGKRVYRGDVVADGDWEPIVSTSEQTRLAEALKDRGSGRRPDAATGDRTYLLTGGLACCGNCGKPLQAKPPAPNQRSYACVKTPPISGCGKIRIKAEPLEEFIGVRVLGKLASKRVMSKLQAAVVESEETGRALAEEIDDVQKQMRSLGQMWAAREIGETAFKAADQVLQTKLRGLRAQVAEVTQLGLLTDVARLTTPEELANWWENEATMQEKHDLVEVLVDEVKIEPSMRRGFRGLDEDRVTIIWKPAY